jgi:hypothetical protein
MVRPVVIPSISIIPFLLAAVPTAFTQALTYGKNISA